MKISSGTIARTICLCLALINQVFVIFGREAVPIAEEEVYQLMSIIFTICSSVSAWWKNNSFTSTAIEADTVLQKRKNELLNKEVN